MDDLWVPSWLRKPTYHWLGIWLITDLPNTKREITMTERDWSIITCWSWTNYNDWTVRLHYYEPQIWTWGSECEDQWFFSNPGTFFLNQHWFDFSWICWVGSILPWGNQQFSNPKPLIGAVRGILGLQTFTDGGGQGRTVVDSKLEQWKWKRHEKTYLGPSPPKKHFRRYFRP